MNKTATYPLETALRAFAEHVPVIVRLNDGTAFGPGYIIMMYGDIAFRMLEEKTQESRFIRMNEIKSLKH